ncbi:MAG: redoxin domain-containing protein [Chitinophagales bacterium]
MKKSGSIFLILAATGLLLSFVWKISDLPIGSALPKTNVKLKDISDREITLKDAQQKNGILVMFSCNTCPVVRANQTRTNGICKYAAANQIGVVLLNSNEASRGDNESLNEMKAYAKDNGYSWYYAIDKNSELADAFGANRTPECFLFDKNSKLVYHGAIDDSPSDVNSVKRQHLKIAIDEMVSGKDISIKESRSVGCSIKRL